MEESCDIGSPSEVGKETWAGIQTVAQCMVRSPWGLQSTPPLPGVPQPPLAFPSLAVSSVEWV
jgi:hypothetical protein